MHNTLLHPVLAQILEELRSNPSDVAWARAARALRAARDDDPDIDESDAAVAIELEDVEELDRLVTGWRDRSITLPVSDRAILKRAMKALRKRRKLTRLDEESSLGGRGLTSGRQSSISAVRAPEQYPTEVWELLIRSGRLRDVGHGLLEPIGEHD